MSESHADALVFFGATGDLAYKKIFRALQALVKRNQLDVRVIGVGRSRWDADRLRARIDGESMRDEKVKVLKSIPALDPEDLVRGQFRGYREEPGVAPDSKVETFAALRLRIESWRWQGVPFYIRAGKALPVSCSEVIARLRPAPRIFPSCPGKANYFRFRISPEMTIALGATVMDAGDKEIGQPVELLASRRPGAQEMDAYERVLGDAMAGDATLFAREDYVEEAWRIVDPVLNAGTPVYEYEPGTCGPSEVEQHVRPPDGWHNPVVEA